MSNVNKVILVGFLGKDPETRQAGASKVCNFSLATSEAWTDKAGTKQERTQWHNIQAWNKTAELCAQYLKKGRQVYIEGKIVYENYEDKDGVKKTATKIVAESVQFLGGDAKEVKADKEDDLFSF